MDSSKENVVIIDGEKHFPILKKGDHCEICSLREKCYNLSNDKDQLCSILLNERDFYFSKEENKNKK